MLHVDQIILIKQKQPGIQQTDLVNIDEYLYSSVEHSIFTYVRTRETYIPAYIAVHSWTEFNSERVIKTGIY